jgi:hypothetical protein
MVGQETREPTQQHKPQPVKLRRILRLDAVLGRGDVWWRIFAAPRPPGLHYGVGHTPWRGDTLLPCPPDGTYNYGHRRSQIGINIYARCPSFVCHTNIVLSYGRFYFLYTYAVYAGPRSVNLCPNHQHHFKKPSDIAQATTMASYPPLGLPTSPRANRQMAMLSPLNTSFSSNSTSAQPWTPSPSPYSSNPQKPIDIFANATIPLSPSSSTSSSQNPYEGLEPRKRSGLARLFCCFGREERARRRVDRSRGFEKVGEMGHWSEY